MRTSFLDFKTAVLTGSRFFMYSDRLLDEECAHVIAHAGIQFDSGGRLLPQVRGGCQGALRENGNDHRTPEPEIAFFISLSHCLTGFAGVDDAANVGCPDLKE